MMENQYKIKIILLLFLCSSYLQAQVGIGTTSPDASAALEINSNNAGVLIPRMTKIDRDAILSPAQGLLIYQTDATEGFYYYNSTTTSWQGINQGKRYLGEEYKGGIVFHIYNNDLGEQHGLIVCNNESSLIKWQTTGVVTNANRTEDGQYNTELMTDSPAKNYITTLGAGWYMPSIDELVLLYANRYHVNKALRLGGHKLLSNKNYYWSSTEYSSTNAWLYNFGQGGTPNTSKTSVSTVRAIRAF